MPQKKALVLNGGQIEQLQSSDYIITVDIPQLINGNAGSLVIGTGVYASANDTVDKAKSDAVGTVNIIGLVSDASIATGATGGVQMDGILAATTGQWDTVAGTSGGLTRDVIYYLSPTTAGNITSIAPTTTGQFVQEIGIGVSTTELKINIKPRVKL